MLLFSLLFSFCPAAAREATSPVWKMKLLNGSGNGNSGCRGLCEGKGAVGRQGAVSKRQQIFCSIATASRSRSAKCETVSNWALPPPPVPPLPLFPASARGDGSVHSSVQLGENKWFSKRLEVCNHLNFTSFVLFMISVHNFLSVHPPLRPSKHTTTPSPPAVHIPCHQITEPNKIILIYMQDEQQRRLSPGAAARPPAQAESLPPFFFVYFFRLSIDLRPEVDGGGGRQAN